MPENRPSPEHGAFHDVKLDILDLLIVVLKHKRLILICFLTALALSVAAYVYFQPRTEYGRTSLPLYKSEVVLFTEDIGKIEAILHSRRLLHNVIEKNNLLPRLFPDQWDPQNAKWLADHPPSADDAYRKLQNSLRVKVNKTAFRDRVVFMDKTTFMVTVSILSPDASLPQYVLTQLVAELKLILRDLQDADHEMQLKNIQRLLSQEASYTESQLATLLSVELKKGAAKADIIDPPSAAEQIPPAMQNRMTSIPAYVWVVPVLVFFLAVLLAFFLEYLKNLIADEPEKFRKFKSHLVFRRH